MKTLEQVTAKPLPAPLKPIVESSIYQRMKCRLDLKRSLRLVVLERELKADLRDHGVQALTKLPVKIRGYNEYEYRRRGVWIRLFITRSETPVLTDFNVSTDDGGVTSGGGGPGGMLVSTVPSYCNGFPRGLAAAQHARPIAAHFMDRNGTIFLGTLPFLTNSPLDSHEGIRGARYARTIAIICSFADNGGPIKSRRELTRTLSIHEDIALSRSEILHLVFGDIASDFLFAWVDNEGRASEKEQIQRSSSVWLLHGLRSIAKYMQIDGYRRPITPDVLRRARNGALSGLDAKLVMLGEIARVLVVGSTINRGFQDTMGSIQSMVSAFFSIDEPSGHESTEYLERTKMGVEWLITSSLVAFDGAFQLDENCDMPVDKIDAFLRGKPCSDRWDALQATEGLGYGVDLMATALSVLAESIEIR